MSNLLDHGNDPDKNVKVNVKSVSRKEAGFGDSDNDLIPTFDVNIRVDNHTRNAILALSKISPDNQTASAVVAKLVESYTENLNPQSLEVYQDFADMLEKKDKLNYKFKNK
ncbi:DUF5388 domain-containing protein [Fructilactobacillus sanfranciscensis]|uniref:DUF5388 domain-containing protein n=1 Tax=Fructilactobacillus sanfranciscensis TaxID=1625 RepID=UPI0011197E03|nr:DUF5388 domain-containing protein [Fructilactobacillus sanfranciscensis]MVF16007.1 hypothetical protein [Fructilactobacillus sanfranciscensis]TNK94890.1 hypothetical protein DKP74_07170 [Fructilactobacillus sanfranciscensis]TNK96705.1 hypothetical protein DKP75_07025 [Fructilactobacillus sanfranciscensis]